MPMFFAPGDNNMRIMPILVPFSKIVTIRKHQLEVECSFIFSSYFFYFSLLFLRHTHLTSVCRGSRAILGEILWVFPCSRHGELLPTLAQSDVEVVSGSCGTGRPDLCPGLQTQSEWESEGSTERWEDCDLTHAYTRIGIQRLKLL